MTFDKVKEAEAVCKEFLRVLTELKYEELKERKERRIHDNDKYLYTKGTQYSSAVRRKSMDLTRVLAKLRKY